MSIKVGMALYGHPGEIDRAGVTMKPIVLKFRCPCGRQLATVHRVKGELHIAMFGRRLPRPHAAAEVITCWLRDVDRVAELEASGTPVPPGWTDALEGFGEALELHPDALAGIVAPLRLPGRTVAVDDDDLLVTTCPKCRREWSLGDQLAEWQTTSGTRPDVLEAAYSDHMSKSTTYTSWGGQPFEAIAERLALYVHLTAVLTS